MSSPSTYRGVMELILTKDDILGVYNLLHQGAPVCVPKKTLEEIKKVVEYFTKPGHTAPTLKYWESGMDSPTSYDLEAAIANSRE